MERRPVSKLIGIMTALFVACALPASAPAQFSDSYNFLKAVKDKDGNKVTELLQGAGASTMINTKDYDNGDGALHIVAKRRDDLWLRFLLGKGANPNIRDKEGNSPLLIASRIAFPEGVAALIAGKADVNLANARGETPLIISVQLRDVVSIRLLLAAGADPNKTDHIAGMSARDYAARDTRSAAILKLIDEAAKATKPAAKVAGPGL